MTRRLPSFVLTAAALVLVAGAATACGKGGSAGGGTGPVTVHLEAAGSPTADDLAAAATVVQNRLVAADIAGSVRSVESGVDVRFERAVDKVQLEQLIERPGKLEFRPVLEMAPSALRAGDGEVVLDMGSGKDQVWYRLGDVAFGGDVLESVSATEGDGDRWELHPVLRAGADGIDRFNAMASHCVAQDDTCPTGQLAFVLDDRVLSAPAIVAEGFERDQILISGAFDEREARILAAVLNGGALRLDLQVAVPR